MDKYQEFLMRRLSYRYEVYGCQKGYRKKESISECIVEIIQDEDITITKYDLFVESDVVGAIFSVKNEEKTEEWRKEKNLFSCVMDFDDQADGFLICFKDNIADDLFIKLVFRDGNKEAYYAKKHEEKRAEYIAKATISHAVGINLINVYFQLCDLSCERTELDIYLKKTHQLVVRSSLTRECYYFVIKDLAPNEYEYVLKQYDKQGNLLFQTDNIELLVSDIIRTYNRSNSRF